VNLSPETEEKNGRNLKKNAASFDTKTFHLLPGRRLLRAAGPQHPAEDRMGVLGVRGRVSVRAGHDRKPVPHFRPGPIGRGIEIGRRRLCQVTSLAISISDKKTFKQIFDKY
jgi:hypothetical protein